MLPISSTIEPNLPIAYTTRQLILLDDSGAVRRIGFAELIGQIWRDGIAAIQAVCHILIDGHTACRVADMVVVVAIALHGAWSEAHGRFLSFAPAYAGLSRASPICLATTSIMIIRLPRFLVSLIFWHPGALAVPHSASTAFMTASIRTSSAHAYPRVYNVKPANTDEMLL